MKKVICFCRVSSLAQDLENQRNEVTATIKRDGYKSNEIIYVEGKESAIKKDEEERQTLNELKEVIATNPTVKDVYFYAIDRLARKVSVVLSIVDKMTAQGVNLHFLNPYPMQTLKDGKEDSMGKMFLTFLAIGAEMEMKMKNERFKTTRLAMKNEGKLVVGKVLYGYYRDKNGFPQIKDDEAQTVIDIFTLYLSGKSMRKIAEYMIESGKLITNSINSAIVKISNIINNPAYSGRQPKQYDSKEPKLIKYPAIVDAKSQDEAMQKSAENNHPKETKNIYFGKGIVKTEDNGKLYAMSPLKGNASYCYRNSENKQYNISVNVIDTILFKVAKEIYKIKASYDDFIKPQEVETQIVEMEQKIKNIEPVIDKYDAQLKRINKLYTSGRLDESDYESEYDKVNDEKQTFAKKIIEYQMKIERLKNEVNNIEDAFKKDYHFEEMTDEEKAEMIKTYIEVVKVEKIGKYESLISIEPTPILKIGIQMPYYTLNISGGKKRLFEHWATFKEPVDISNEIVQRFKAPNRHK